MQPDVARSGPYTQGRTMTKPLSLTDCKRILTPSVRTGVRAGVGIGRFRF